MIPKKYATYQNTKAGDKIMTGVMSGPSKGTLV